MTYLLVMNPIAFDSPVTTAAYLRTLPAIRERCSRVHTLAKEGKLDFFDYHPEKESEVAAFCVEIIKARRTPVYIQHKLTMIC